MLINIKQVLRKYPKFVAFFVIFCVSIFRWQTHDLYTGADLGFVVHFINVNEFYSHRRNWPTSKLGAVLFKGEKFLTPNLNKNKQFKILIWDSWDWQRIYIFRIQTPGKYVLDGCSVTNCEFTGDNRLFDTADAVVVFLQNYKFPQVENRNPEQRWIFLNQEPPCYAFGAERGRRYDHLDKMFNWSMTYRTDADVPIPYGRTIPLDEPIMADPTSADIATLVPYWDQKQTNVLASIMMTNCGVPLRNNLLKTIKEHMNVDVYGPCSEIPEFKDRCPGRAYVDCNVTEQYLFYLALENSQCFQYITEKVFYNAFAKGAVPIIWGPHYEDIRTLLPPHSFIYVDEKTDVKSLVEEIVNLSKNYDMYLSLHRWRNHFKVVNEHGYFGTKSHYTCRLCEALNYNDWQKKILNLNDLHWYFNESMICKPY